MPSEDTMPIEHPELAERLGQANYVQRLRRQRSAANPNNERGARIRRRRLIHRLIRFTLTASGMRGRGLRNFHDLHLVDHELRIADLPPAFDGYQIIQIADLHLDMRPELLTPAVLGILETTDYDLCLNTGDYVFQHDQWATTMEYFSQIAQAIDRPHYGVLGNHDLLHHAPPLEAAGIRLLLNEAAPIEHGGETLWLVGVDDPHFFISDDLERALSNVPAGAATLLLAHAPNIAEKAAASGRIGAMLCGHTHGGQICLPGGYPILTHENCPRGRIRGAWQVGAMPGYTSPGTGASGVAARFNCPPEITRHTLRPV